MVQQNLFHHWDNGSCSTINCKYGDDIASLFYDWFERFGLSTIFPIMVCKYVYTLNPTVFVINVCLHLIIHFSISTRLPFNWKMFPVGYPVAFCFQYLHLFWMANEAFLVSSFMTSCYFMLRAITADIRHELIALNENLNPNKNYLKSRTKFYELIQFRSDAKQLSEN